MPVGCGVWSQLRLQDPERFPNHGEITIVDGVNNGKLGNTIGLFVHATSCSMSSPRVWRKATASADGPTDTCSQRLHGLKGCRYLGGNNTYGSEWNTNGGGVVALEWRDDGIRQWQWHRDEVPRDILVDAPKPEKWGRPLADFPSTRCSLREPNLGKLAVVANINLCGLRPEYEWNQSECEQLSMLQVAE